MIYYVCHPGHAYTVAVMLLYYGEALRPCFRLVPYGKLESLRTAAPGAVIWTDFDRLGEAELAAAGAIGADLAARSDLIQLNDPRRSEQRFALLRRLRACGRNSFDVRRPDESLEGLRYPVFLRDEVGASYRAPTLLPDRAALQAALAAPAARALERPMIVEFGVVPGADGFYRKYGAYRVGPRIFPQHLYLERQWFIKHGSTLLAQHRQEFLEYVTCNPHAAELMPLFEEARIDYGRIDYTLVEGRIQVFEINTNPAVLSNPPTRFDSYDQRKYGQPWIDALLALPGAGFTAAQGEIDARHERLLRPLRRHYARLHRSLTLRGAWRRLRQAAGMAGPAVAS
jgi:hypothetical protein